MKETMQLNLARKWRSKTFDELVGQKLVVDLLKSSLQRGLFFPAYLLAGMRGTGKTSAGRIFAAALNCRKLPQFQKEGAACGDFPCLQCDSCCAMHNGTHPDFIEIDAASHTGVDSVRQIIDEAAFLPIMGHRKVYLIDEVHMLSKAASNAFLKILEEPPATALFLLATTDAHKIIETVRSRSFQLFFDPIAADLMVAHLARVCDAENIPYEQQGLMLVTRQTSGSVRDALNSIERLRFTTEGVTKRAVQELFGDLDDDELLALCDLIGKKCSLNEFFEFWQEHQFSSYRPTVIWERLVEMVRVLLWASHARYPNQLTGNQERIRAVAQRFSPQLLLDILDIFYRLEPLFAKTAAQMPLLERVLCSIVLRCGGSGSVSGGESAAVPERTERVETGKRFSETQTVQQVVQELPRERVATPVALNEKAVVSDDQPWGRFLNLISTGGGDPLVRSVIQQGVCVSSEGGIVRVKFPQKFVLYQDQLVMRRSWWQPLLEQAFGGEVTLVPDFSGSGNEPGVAAARLSSDGVTGVVEVSSLRTEQVRPVVKSTFTPAQQGARTTGYKTAEKPEKVLQIPEGDEWKQARAMLELFPGTIKIIEESHE